MMSQGSNGYWVAKSSSWSLLNYRDYRSLLDYTRRIGGDVSAIPDLAHLCGVVKVVGEGKG